MCPVLRREGKVAAEAVQAEEWIKVIEVMPGQVGSAATAGRLRRTTVTQVLKVANWLYRAVVLVVWAPQEPLARTPPHHGIARAIQ